MPVKATIIGATGLIGSQILHLLLNDDYFDEVRIISRRPLALKHSKLSISVIDFSNTEAYRDALSGTDLIFCAVGTTQQKVKGNQQQYRKIDYDIPVTAAEIGADQGITGLLLVSSVGANSRSKNFYLRLKGEVEEAVKKAGIPFVGIFRPSMLLGDRPEFRLAEKLIQPLMKLLSVVIPGKYKAIEAAAVAAAMVNASKLKPLKTAAYEYKDIMLLSGKK